MEKDKDKQIIKYIVVFALAVLVVFVAVGVLVYAIDPFFHYHRPIPDFPYVVDNQLTQNPGMAEHMEYDSVILGSSMTVNFETDWFRDLMGLNTLKLSYSSAYPKDISNILGKVYESENGKNLKSVFLGLDIITYSGDVNETKYPLPTYLYDKNPLNDINYLLNKDVLLNYVLRPMADPEPTNLSHVYASWWTEDYYNEEWVLLNHESPAKRTEPMAKDAFNEGIRTNLEINIVPYIANHPDTTFYIFFPPYSILFWDDVLIDNRLEATISAYECVEEYLNEYDNVKLYFFPADKETVTNLNNYADYSHYKPDINYYMTQSFVDGNDYVAKDFESGNHMADYISKMRKIINEYNFDELNRKLDSYR